MKQKTILAIFLCIFFQLSGASVNWYISPSGASIQCDNHVDDDHVSNAIYQLSGSSGMFEAVVSCFPSSGEITQYRFKPLSLVEYSDSGNDGYRVGTDTVIASWEFPQLWNQFTSPSVDTFRCKTTTNKFQLDGKIDLAETQPISVISLNYTKIRYSGFRTAATTSIALKAELIAKRVDTNIVFRKSMDEILKEFGTPFTAAASSNGYATLIDGSRVYPTITFSQDVTGSSYDTKYIIYISFIGAFSNVDFNDFVLMKKNL